MSSRKWMRLSEWKDNRIHHIHKVKCGAGGCSNEHIVRNFSGGAVAAGIALSKKFRAQGWQIGHVPEDDRCPDCYKAMMQRARSKLVEEHRKVPIQTATDPVGVTEKSNDAPPAASSADAAPQLPEDAVSVPEAVAKSGAPFGVVYRAIKRGWLKGYELNNRTWVSMAEFSAWDAARPRRDRISGGNTAPAPTTLNPATPPKEEELKPTAPPEPVPRQPSREQRRRILEALDDTYPQPEKGYTGGMSDELLAKRLDMPRIWVTELRDQLYGPEFIIDVRSLQTRLAILEGQYRELESELLEKMSALSRQIAVAKTEVEAIGKQVGARA